MRVVLAGGGGGVGSSVAHNLLVGGEAHELVLIDPSEDRAASHVMDLEQVVELGGRGNVRVGGDDDIADADVVVISASPPLRANGSRLEFLHESAAVVAPYADRIRGLGPGWPGVAIMVTNPVDPLVTAMRARCGLDRRRFIGYTLNDTLRLRTGIATALGRPLGSVEAWAFGEHGDGCVPVLSMVRVDNEPVTLTTAQAAQAREFLHGWYVRHVALDPTRSSTWTSGRGVAQMVTALGRDEPTLFPASVVLDGEYGLHDVSLTVPTMLRRGGVADILEWPLDPAERAALAGAARIVARAAAAL